MPHNNTNEDYLFRRWSPVRLPLRGDSHRLPRLPLLRSGDRGCLLHRVISLRARYLRDRNSHCLSRSRGYQREIGVDENPLQPEAAQFSPGGFFCGTPPYDVIGVVLLCVYIWKQIITPPYVRLCFYPTAAQAAGLFVL